MTHNRLIAGRCLQVPGIVILIYLAAYPLLRVSHVLVRRDYTINVRDDTHLIFANYVDVGRGAAFDHGEPRYDSVLGTFYAPVSLVELRLRGYGPRPRVWSGDDICDQ
jgi:hypothetical protein